MFVFLNEKDYQKAKGQIETLSKRETFLISALGSIQGIHAWVTLYNNFFGCAGGRVFFAVCLIVSAACAVYLFLKLHDTIKIAYNFSLFGFLVMLYPKYPDAILAGAGISIFIFLLCLSVPAFTLAVIQTKAKQYIMHYEDPGRYSSKRRIFIKEKAKG